MRRRIVCILAMAIAIAFCWLRSYEVLPTQAAWSGWVPEEGYAGQTFTANFDSLVYCVSSRLQSSQWWKTRPVASIRLGDPQVVASAGLRKWRSV